ncbi:MAG: heat shock protein HspQ [Gammaproteobacteria bacterium]
MSKQANFSVGQLVHHKLLKYRGVIVDVDPNFQSSETWYELMALSKPPKNEPWYHVLVDDADFMTYVAEQNLEPDTNDEPINHPEVKKYFSAMKNGTYVSKRSAN